jgi:hypothetical protein
MSLFPRWLHGWLRGSAPDSQSGLLHDQDPTAGALEQARALARDGHLHAAAHAYSKITRRHGTAEIMLEHADVLLAIGDNYGAAAIATRVLDINPQDSKGLAIRRKVIARDLEERKG